MFRLVYFFAHAHHQAQVGRPTSAFLGGGARKASLRLSTGLAQPRALGPLRLAGGWPPARISLNLHLFRRIRS